MGQKNQKQTGAKLPKRNVYKAPKSSKPAPPDKSMPKDRPPVK